MRLGRIRVAAAALVVAAGMGLSGCSSSSPNQVAVLVAPVASTVIAGTTVVLVSTVTGSTNLDSTWSCSYSYTPAATSSNPTPKAVTGTCTSGGTINGGSFGTWSTSQTSINNTLTYNAPQLSNFPNPIPTLTFTAVAAANTSKKGTGTVNLDTGIRVAVTPTTATVPVGLSPAQQVQFTASLLNAPPLNLTWAVMQPVTGDTTDFPNGLAPGGATCSPNCGSITAQGLFTAPGTMPTDTYPKTSGSDASTAAPVVYVVVNSQNDTEHFAVAKVTLVNASTNPITFTGIEPTTIAAGGALQDIFLDAHNILNTTTITFTPPGTNQTPQVIDPSTNVFTIPITAAYCTPSAAGVSPVVTCDASIMTRIRLTPTQLGNAGVGQVTVSNIPSPSNNGETVSISYPLNLVYASPTVVSAVPYNYQQGVSASVSTDGGYYGSGNNALVELLFNGSLNLASSFSPRQFTGPLQGSQTNSPGLYPVSIAWAQTTQAPPFNPPPYTTATKNVAVQPVFSNLSSTYFPTPAPATPVTPPFITLPGTGNLAPSSIALNSAKGYAVLTEQASNSVEIVTFAQTATGRWAPQASVGPITVGNQPTSVSIDNQIDLTGVGYAGQDLGVIVNSADSTLTLMALPAGNIIGSPISLSGLLQEPPGTSAPLPYSVGVDPITHYAVVAFSNATLGFIVDVNPNPPQAAPAPQPPACFLSTQTAPCAIASVSLNTGPTPQVVMQPDAPLAYVTPGGSGVTSVVNLLLTDNTVTIAASPNGASCTAGIATITTPTTNNLNQVAPGAVLIQGVTPTAFNGTYNVLTASSYTFTYAMSCPTNITGGGGSVTFGNPYYTFSTSPTVAGAAINPITRTLAFADPGASSNSPQIGFIGTLDQSVTSLYLTQGSCQGCTPPTTAPEVGLRYVSWDPYTDVLIVYNPANNYNQISLINPGGPTATGSQSPYRIIQAIPTGQTGLGSYTPSGATTPVSVYGPMVYDPKTNLVLVANAGSNTLTFLDLNPSATFKPVQIGDVLVTSGGVPSSQPPLAAALTPPATPPVAVCDPTQPTNPYATCLPRGVTVGSAAQLRILGEGFTSGGTPVVRLDGDPTGVTITNSTDSEVDVTIAASRLAVAHDFALDVISGSVGSNTMDLYAVQITTLPQCGSPAVNAEPEGVAFDPIRKVGLVTDYACSALYVLNLDATNTQGYSVPYGSIMSTVKVGAGPLGVDVVPRLGYAVVANNSEGSASIVNISNPQSASLLAFTSANCTGSSGSVASTNICTGVAPTGVAIDYDRALALIANTGGNSISAIDLTPLLLATPPSTLPMQLVATSGPPKAIAVDPNRAVAVVTNIQNAGTAGESGGLDVINISISPPAKTTTASISSISANPTGIVYDPAVSPALFYVASTQQNAIYAFDPDTSSVSQIRVGINPYSIAYNYQTGTLLTINSTSNTTSIVDAVSAPVFATRETLGISSQSQFAAAMDNFTNTAIIADQNNFRVLIFPMP